MFNVALIAQKGKIQYEALLFLASFRRNHKKFSGDVFVCIPKGPLWTHPPCPDPALLDEYRRFGAQIIFFENKLFGEKYPHGNKIEALNHLPDAPFVFFDTDTLFLGDIADISFDFTRPSASMRRTNTWPRAGMFSTQEIWQALYRRFNLDFKSTCDTGYPEQDWRRYLYFNAGWFFYKSPQQFFKLFSNYAYEVYTAPPPELAGQALAPWLDQIVLPLTIHALKGGRPDAALSGLDGAITCHYRRLALLYARESNDAVTLLEDIAARADIAPYLKEYAPFRKVLYEGKGRQIRDLFSRHLPQDEIDIRKILRINGLWDRF